MKTLPLIALLTIAQSLSAQSSKDFTVVLNANAVSLPADFLSDNGSTMKWDKRIHFEEFKVVAVGEQTHGTSEFFKARTSLIKKLAKQYPISKIGLEAPMAEVEQLNCYLLNQKA